jgi:hypothetical protein
VRGNPLVSDRWRWPKLGRRIDCAFVRRGDRGLTLDVSACDRVFDEPVGGVWAGDHFGVVADLVGVG